MDINSLNIDVLLKIFTYLSLNDILNLEFVCKRWQKVQRHICKRQTSLKLFGCRLNLASFIYCKGIHFSQLQCCPYFGSINDTLLIATLDWSICRLLVSKFPNLNMLWICGCTVSKGVLIEFLLTQWKQIRCLSFIHLMGEIVWCQVWPALEALPHLKHLALFGVEGELKLPTVLRHLEQLQLERYEASLWQVLTQLGTDIRFLGIYDANLTTTCLSQMVNLNCSVKKQITHLAIKSAFKHPEAERSLLQFVSTNLSSLTTLALYSEPGLRIDDLLVLKQLPHLTELSLHAAEKSDLTTIRELADYPYSDQFQAIKVLNLDIDIDTATLEVLALLFPNIEKTTINFGRICCTCTEYPEVIEIPPLVQNPVPVVNEQMLPPPTAPVNLPNQPPALEEPRIFEEDNCEFCSERAMLTLSSWKRLVKLGVTGDRIKESAIKAMSQCNQLQCLLFASCVNYSLKLLLNVCYSMANARKPQLFQLKINTEKFSKIIKLAQKPNNLTVENVDPIVDCNDIA